MQPTPDMDIQSEYCRKLRKSLYGLMQAPIIWFYHFREFIKRLRFKQTVPDKSLYVLKHDGELFLLSLYVDDIIIARSNLEGL